MGRYTIRNSDGSVSQPTNLDWSGALQKLADYEDEAEQREKGCEYCKTDIDGYSTAFGAFWVEDTMLRTKHCKPRPINYCPMCGRKLR